MRWLKLIRTGWVLASVSAMLFAVAIPTMAKGTTSHGVYSFELTTANTAASPNGGTMASPGDWISVTGSGIFNPIARTVSARGSFVHYSSSGAVDCQGTWNATGFTSFTDFGTNADGEEGGVLSMVVTHYCKTMGMTMTGIPMTVTSTAVVPAGSSYVEGTTVGDFTKPTGGIVVMQPEQ
jgi:hypothetical protein